MTCSEYWRLALPPTCDSSRLPLSEKLGLAVYVVEGLGPHRVLLCFLGIEEMGGRLCWKSFGQGINDMGDDWFVLFLATLERWVTDN